MFFFRQTQPKKYNSKNANTTEKLESKMYYRNLVIL